MPHINVLPHPELCPEGKSFDLTPGDNLLDGLVEAGIPLEHSCEKQGVCATCHVIIQEGFDSVSDLQEKEEETLDFAWGLQPLSRLACQVIVGEEDLVVEIPRYHTHIVS